MEMMTITMTDEKVTHIIQQAQSFADRRRQADDYQCTRLLEKLIETIKEIHVTIGKDLIAFNPRELELISSQKEDVTRSSFIEVVDASVKLTLMMHETTYVYDNVPFKVVEGLMKAKSLGKFFNENIKGKYRVDK